MGHGEGGLRGVEIIDLVFARQAAFERPLFEAAIPSLAGVPWACAGEDVAWFGVTPRSNPPLDLLARQFDERVEATAAGDAALLARLLDRRLNGQVHTAWAYGQMAANRIDLRLLVLDPGESARPRLKAAGFSRCTARDLWGREVSSHSDLHALAVLVDHAFFNDEMPEYWAERRDARVRFSARLGELTRHAPHDR